MRILRILIVAGALVVGAAALVWVGNAWWQSRLPGTYDAMAYAVADYGGGAPFGHEHAGGFDIARLTGPRSGKPDDRFTLHAGHARVKLASGREVDALAFDGRVPGPELRVRQGDLVQVTLVNDDVDEGVTIHWHGVDVPNAEDGVAGVTQDAVRPGGRYVYRFRAGQAGTFWYHTHQDSADDVARGLFGALVVEPRDRPAGVDLALVAHDADGTLALNGVDEVAHRAVRPGTQVRVRLVNTESTPQRFGVAGTPFRLLAIDGTDLRGPDPIQGQTLELAAGGRYDVGFTMPRGPVAVGLTDAPARFVFSADGRTDAPPLTAGARFDPLAYGQPVPTTPFGADSHFDRSFQLRMTKKFGFVDGGFRRQWALNGRLYPSVPMFMVRPGELIRLELINDTASNHPMHLHGHHALVLSQNGQRSTGSPWWTDTLNVAPHERYVVAFRADNPGIWMDHCHNLGHAAAGLTMHLAYEGFTTPFRVGGAARNRPE